MMFCKEYNARTADQPGMIIPVEITVFEDKSFTFVLKTPPASVLLKKAAGITKGSAQLEKVGSITKEQLAEIATIKMPDLNAHHDRRVGHGDEPAGVPRGEGGALQHEPRRLEDCVRESRPRAARVT